jgi:hypothetical protein
MAEVMISLQISTFVGYTLFIFFIGFVIGLKPNMYNVKFCKKCGSVEFTKNKGKVDKW